MKTITIRDVNLNMMCMNDTRFLQVNVFTQRGFVPVDERMQVMDADGNAVC
jgi:hypothetical protein